MAQTRSDHTASARHQRTPQHRTSAARQDFSIPDLHAALRRLPSHGWNSGWTGRRDRALLVLSEMAGLSYDTIAELTVADIGIADGVATICTPGGTTSLHADGDVLLCGPCALARWIHALDLAAARPTGRIATAVIARAAPLTERSPHLCECTVTVAEAALQAPILPVTDAWGPRLPAIPDSDSDVIAPAADRVTVIAFPMDRATAAIPAQRAADGLIDDRSTAAVPLRLSNYFRADLERSAPAKSGTAATLAGRARQLLDLLVDDERFSAGAAR